MLEGILGIVGDEGVNFLDNLDGAFLSADGPLALPLTFVRALDPFADDGPFRPVLEELLNFFQEVVGLFIFGDEDIELPSQRNEVLNLKERRDGTIYLASGCDSGECRHASEWSYRRIIHMLSTFC